MTNGLTLPAPADGAAALAAAMAWIAASEGSDELFSPGLKPLDISGGSESLAQHLTAAGLLKWRDAIVATAAPGQPLHLDPPLAWLMAHTALEVAVSATRTGLFHAVDELKILGNVSDRDLAAAICTRVAGQADSFPLLARLQKRLQGLWGSRLNDRLRHYAERTAGAPLTTRGLWLHHDGMPMGDGWAHQAAATLWPERYMALLTGQPSLFQSGFAEPLEPLEVGRVATLVSVCPPIFSDDGKPLGPVVPFVLLEAIETRLPAMDDMTSAEAAVSRLLEAVLSRPDGRWLGRAWLQQIIWRSTPRRAGRAKVDVDAQRAVRDHLLAGLSTNISPLESATVEWIRAEEPLWAVHRILAEASILEAHGDAVAAAEILANGVRQGLVTATGRADGMITRSPESDVVGRVLYRIPDLARWFETLWRETYEVREALSYPVERNLDNPAYPALSWALNGLNVSQQAPVDTAGLWRAIAGAVFETQRLDPNAWLFNGAMPPIIRVTVQLGAVLAERGILPIDDLAGFLGDQLDPTAEHIRLWQIARAEASDALTLEAARKIGAILVREAIETALNEPQPSWGVALDPTANADLTDFARRL
jgi:predicted DNA-binding protein